MTRVVWRLGLCLAAFVPGSAWAVDLPLRKAGLWEIKMVRPGSPMPEMTMQHCTDETTDKDMMVSPMGRQICSRQDVQKTTTGYVSDSVCSTDGVSVSSHSEITGDFNSAFAVTTTSHSDRGSKAAPGDSVTKIEAKWLGACKADQKPGDHLLPGGLKFNIKDLPSMR